VLALVHLRRLLRAAQRQLLERLPGGVVNPGYGLGVGIVCAPFISAILYALRSAGRALYRTARTRSTR
jgi:hypothetical protein